MAAHLATATATRGAASRGCSEIAVLASARCRSLQTHTPVLCERKEGVAPSWPAGIPADARDARLRGRAPPLGRGTSTTVAALSSRRRSGVNGNTVSGVPAAAQTSSSSRSAGSHMVGTGAGWPNGGVPPIAKPVAARASSALGLAGGPAAPKCAAESRRRRRGARPTSTRAPARRRPRRTRATSRSRATSQPIAAAASATVRVPSGKRVTSIVDTLAAPSLRRIGSSPRCRVRAGSAPSPRGTTRCARPTSCGWRRTLGRAVGVVQRRPSRGSRARARRAR